MRMINSETLLPCPTRKPLSCMNPEQHHHRPCEHPSYTSIDGPLRCSVCGEEYVEPKPYERPTPAVQPIPVLTVCDECNAVVPEIGMEFHQEWHDKISRKLSSLRSGQDPRLFGGM